MPNRGRTRKVLSLEEKIFILEELATEMLKKARALPKSAERHDILKEIGHFRVRIAALRKSGHSPP
jgi:hypothetical protein